MTNDSSFSVLIPAHRAAGTIAATLATAVAQTLPPAEILVYEDGRRDDLADVVAACAARSPVPIRLLGSAVNRGVSAARNALLDAARGASLAFLDADDLWRSDHLAQAARAFALGADVAFSGVTFVDAAGCPLPGRAEPAEEDLGAMATALYRYNFVQCTSTVCVRRAALDRAGRFDEQLSYGEDLDLWLRLLAAGARWRYTGHCSCAYRKHAASAMGQTLVAVERLAAFYEKHLHNDLLPRRVRRRALATNRWNHARLNWRRRPAEAGAALRRLIRLQPWNPAASAALLAVSAWSRWSGGRSAAVG
jgi:glycosyltransferase involved in cell wall biosynthesis